MIERELTARRIYLMKQAITLIRDEADSKINELTNKIKALEGAGYEQSAA